MILQDEILSSFWIQSHKNQSQILYELRNGLIFACVYRNTEISSIIKTILRLLGTNLGHWATQEALPSRWCITVLEYGSEWPKEEALHLKMVSYFGKWMKMKACKREKNPLGDFLNRLK